MDVPALQSDLLDHFKSFGYVSSIRVKTDLSNRCRGFAFVIFCDVDAATQAVQHQHPIWDIKLKVDLPMYVEGEQRPKQRANLFVRSNAPLRLPFGTGDRVLLLGEGDFSFARATVAAGLLSTSKTVATSNNDPRNLEHLGWLVSQGVQCHTDVDVFNSMPRGPFDLVMFNFPHTGEPSIERNQLLLAVIFRRARAVLGERGRVAISLKQTWPYIEWGVEDRAREEGFRLSCSYDFPAEELHKRGYTHATTDDIPHSVGFLDAARTSIFLAS